MANRRAVYNLNDAYELRLEYNIITGWTVRAVTRVFIADILMKYFRIKDKDISSVPPTPSIQKTQTEYFVRLRHTGSRNHTWSIASQANLLNIFDQYSYTTNRSISRSKYKEKFLIKSVNFFAISIGKHDVYTTNPVYKNVWEMTQLVSYSKSHVLIITPLVLRWIG